MSSVPLRDEDQVNVDLASAGIGSSKLIGRLSMKRTHNPYVDGVLRKKGGSNKNEYSSDVDVEMNEPLMANDKTKKRAAAKMVKGMCVCI